jgi:hypothetical protein
MRIGDREEAIRLLQETRRRTRTQGAKRVTPIAAELGMK